MCLSVRDKYVTIKNSVRIIKIIPDDLGGEAEPRPLLALGDGDRLSFPAGLMEVSRGCTCFRGGVPDILFIAFFGEPEPEELLPEDEAERERLLQDTKSNHIERKINPHG